MSELHDRELVDTLARARRRRKRTAVEVVLDTDRTSPRWQRIRAALCEHTGLREPLDEYADRIFLTVTGGHP